MRYSIIIEGYEREAAFKLNEVLEKYGEKVKDIKYSTCYCPVQRALIHSCLIIIKDK